MTTPAVRPCTALAAPQKQETQPSPCTPRPLAPPRPAPPPDLNGCGRNKLYFRPAPAPPPAQQRRRGPDPPGRGGWTMAWRRRRKRDGRAAQSMSARSRPSNCGSPMAGRGGRGGAGLRAVSCGGRRPAAICGRRGQLGALVPGRRLCAVPRAGHGRRRRRRHDEHPGQPCPRLRLPSQVLAGGRQRRGQRRDPGEPAGWRGRVPVRPPGG